MFHTLKKAFFINSAIFLISCVIGEPQTLIYAFGTEIIKSAVIVFGMDCLTSEKNALSKESPDDALIDLSDTIYFCSTILVKSTAHFYLTPALDCAGFFQLFLFVPKSFCFEIVFDFVHYWMHRFMHSNPLLYQKVHKIHHKYRHPNAFTTFYLHPVDILLGYCLPLFVASRIIPFCRSDFLLMITYLTYQEVGGHLNRHMAPTSSFAQFIWLPRILSIELYTEDHHLHHQKVICNFAKRFSLWDKVFGTFRPGLQGVKTIKIIDEGKKESKEEGSLKHSSILDESSNDHPF
jgi:sterol desaturase/sphingolipid hydroxylase (fatty acid hydroxylase superfamily)